MKKTDKSICLKKDISLILIISYFSLLSFQMGCSGARQQYQKEYGAVDSDQLEVKDIQLNANEIQYFSNDTKVEEEKEGSSQTDRERVVKNSELPLKFESQPWNVHLSGINFNTTFEESGQILSTPSKAPDDETTSFIEKPTSATYFYDEGLVVTWQKNPPFQAENFTIYGEYRGEIRIKNERGDVELNFDKTYKDEFNEKDPLGKKFLSKIYNLILKKEHNYNCFKEYKCLVYRMNNLIFFQNAYFDLAFSDDNKKFNEVTFFNHRFSENIKGAFDLVSL